MKLRALRRPEVWLYAPPPHDANKRVRFARVFFGRNTGSRNRSPLPSSAVRLPKAGLSAEELTARHADPHTISLVSCYLMLVRWYPYHQATELTGPRRGARS